MLITSTSNLLNNFLSVDKNIKNILQNSENSENKLSDTNLVKLLSSLKIDLKNENKSLLNNIKDIIQELKKLPKSQSKNIEKLEKNIIDIKNIDTKSIKDIIKNSGLFFENKLFKLIEKKITTLQTAISNDTKNILLEIKKEIGDNLELHKKIEKLIMQIEQQQLNSIGENGIFLQLPIKWDELREHYIKIKKLNEKKFYCEIKLHFENYGKLKISIMLYNEKTVSLTFFIENLKFKELIKSNQETLKKSIRNEGININKLQILDFDNKFNPS